MPFPIAVVGVVGTVGVIGVVVGIVNDHSDHSDHSDYSDAAVRRKQELSSKINNEERRLNSAREALADAVRDAAAQMSEECAMEGIELPGSIRDTLREEIKRLKTPDEVKRVLVKMPEAFKRSVDQKLSGELAEKMRELERINGLLERVNSFRLTWRGSEGDENS